MNDPKRVMLLGDTHGNSGWTKRAIAHAAENGCDVIVQLGDFGLWPGYAGRAFLRDVQDTLEDFGVTLYWLDGNHEDHDQINARPTMRKPHERREPWAFPELPSILHLPRGYRWEWWGETFMALGGAVSVDKFKRTEGRSWWPGEALTSEDVKYASRPGKVDVLLCHDAPFGVQIPGIKPKGQSEWPDWVLDEAYDHQRLIRDVAEVTRPDLIAHGHFHRFYQGFHRYSDGREALIQGLDCDGSPMNDATLFLNKE